MKIQNSKEIINDILEKYGFGTVYVENGVSFLSRKTGVCLEASSAVDFLMTSALTGRKAIGFFDELPQVTAKHILRGECVFVSSRLPRHVTIPTVFCRKPEDLVARFLLAFRLSVEQKMPVALILSDNAKYNLTEYNYQSLDALRSQPYLNKNSLEQKFDKESFSKAMASAHKNLSAVFAEKSFEGEILSFSNAEGDFFDFIIPDFPTEFGKSLENKSVKVYESEFQDLSVFLSQNGLADVKLEAVADVEKCAMKDFLCPGCPFAAIFANAKNKELLVVSDVRCKMVTKKFGVKHMTYSAYLGLTNSELPYKTLFVGNASNYTKYSSKLLKNGKVTFLNDCELSDINGCSSVKHPRKITADKNILFAYGCSNIKKYGKVSVKARRCKCLESSDVCPAFEATLCPALFKKDKKIEIDTKLCTGCLVCVVSCKPRAIS